MKVRAMVGVLVFVSIIWATIPTWGMSVNSMRAKGRIISRGRGTSKRQVIRWAGRPDYVEVISEGVADYSKKEVWYYGKRSGTYVIYFSGPKVYKIEFVK